MDQPSLGDSAVVGSLVASGGSTVASRRAAGTRGFAAPAFAGCAFVEGLAKGVSTTSKEAIDHGTT